MTGLLLLLVVGLGAISPIFTVFAIVTWRGYGSHPLLNTAWRARWRFLAVFLLFLPMYMIGSVAHECGHALVLKLFGGSPHIGFHYTGFHGTQPQMAHSVTFWFHAGGPLSTMMTGLIGLVWLALLRRRTAPETPLGVAGWTSTLLALFWARELLVWLTYVVVLLWDAFVGRAHRISCDEINLSRNAGLPDWCVPTILGVIGLAACLFVVVKHPRGGRLVFLTAGPAGALLGFWIWMSFLGPRLLP